MYRKQLNNRKIMYCILIFVLVAVFTMTLAYAALSVALNISGSAKITASNWDIHLENPKVKSGSISNTLPTINNNTIDFKVSFNGIGQYYEFTVDIVNEGTIDAMIDEVIKTPELTEAQSKFIKYEISYVNGDSITEKHKLQASSKVPIKVRIEFRSDIDNAEDLPTSAFSLSLSISLTYTQEDATSSAIPGNGVLASNGSLDDIGTIVTIGTEQFYTIGTEEDNVKLLAMYNLYVGEEYFQGDRITDASKITGKQDSRMIGRDDTSEYNRGVTEFSTNSTSYTGSIAETYVNNYKEIIEEYGIDVVEARLITFDELSNTFNCISTGCYSTPYPWIYSTSYWTMTAYSQEYLYGVYNDGYVSFFEGYSYESKFGIRPVILVKKEDIII